LYHFTFIHHCFSFHQQNIGWQQQNIFGSLLEICVLQSYYTDFPDVGIVAAFDDMLWIANKERKVLQKIKPGKELDIVTSIENIEVSDCSVTPTGDLILKLFKFSTRCQHD
jgi:hypothetical protein